MLLTNRVLVTKWIRFKLDIKPNCKTESWVHYGMNQTNRGALTALSTQERTLCSIRCVPCLSASSHWAEPSASPLPPRLCWDEHLCCCGERPTVCGTSSNLLFPTREEEGEVSNPCVWNHQVPLKSQVLLDFSFFFQTLVKAETCDWRNSHFCSDWFAKALCFSICARCAFVIFLSLARSSSISLIFEVSWAFSSS